MARMNKKKRRKEKGNPNHQYIITLSGDLRSDVPPAAVCGCGWMTEPNQNLYKLGAQAKAHALETGHKLRQHS